MGNEKQIIIGKGKRWKKWFLFTAICILCLSAILFLTIYFSLPDTHELKTENPNTTSLIEQRRQEATEKGKKFRFRQRWVGFAAIPDLLKKSVRISEDAAFYLHQGIDIEELKESLKKNWEKGNFARGGSTITQQLAKNLYLSTTKSVVRKIREYFIARRLEKDLSKNRIFHLYLNLIEFGPGVFGVEAAAKYYFEKSVSDLNLEEIVRLTAVIPRPLKVRANGKDRWLLWRCRWILDTLLRYNYIDQVIYEQTIAKFS
jgi:monofunctional biosynthetic peptidoglycan transglycosylase